MSSVSAVNTLLASTSSTSNSAINVSSILAATAGVSTPGIDVAAAVSAGIYAARAPERVWQAQQATLAAQTTALTAIQTATAALATDMHSLNSLTGPLSARTATSSNTGVVTATAASGTAAGNHTVAVANLALTASWYSDLSSSAGAALPSSTFKITTAGGGSTTISTGVGGTDTLTDLATAITASVDSSGKSLGLKASVVSDSTGSRLAIISTASGAAADFSIASVPTTVSAAGTWTSAAVAAHNTPLGADSFVLTTGPTGAPTNTTITVNAGDSFDTIASNINAQSLGVTASVVTDTAGAHLQIVSADSNSFAVTEPGFGYARAFTGTDAKLTVDGVPIVSASNQVTSAIPGVTLNLTGTISAATPANLTIAPDAGQVSTAINQFVTDYNTAISLVNSQFSYNAATGSQGVLSADPNIRSLQSSLMQTLSTANTVAIGTTTVPDLSALGITQSSDGTLTLNSAVLNTALTNHAGDVQNFFQGASLDGFANSMTNNLSTFTNAGNGAFTVDLSSISKTSAAITDQISRYESLYIANQQKVLTAMYSAAEIALQQLPTQMAQLNAMLGNNTKGS